MKVVALSIRYLNVAVVAVACAACAPIPVGTPLNSNAPAAIPSIAAGDTWTYRVRDAYTGIERGTERYRVDQASGSRVTLKVSRDSGGADETQVYDGQWNWLSRPATNLQTFDYNPAYPAFEFPLAPGKQWHTRLRATDPQDGKGFPVRVDGTVVGWERVKVPAGEFDALKIERHVFFDYSVQGVRGRSQIIEYEWYAPAVKQSVRREARSQYWNVLGGADTGFVRIRGGGGRDDSGPRFIMDNWLVSELVSYSVR